MDPMESAPVNSLVSQPAERSMEGTELKQVSMEREKQVIVNNYYISDGKEGWKQLEKSKIPLNKLENKAQGNFRVITPNRSENGIHGNSSKISPEKSQIRDFNAQLGSEKEARYVDKDQKVTTQAKAEPRRFYEQGAEIQNMSPPPTYNPNYPPPNRYSGNQDTVAMLDCIRQLQLTVQQHILTNSKQAEYHMSQNGDLFTEIAKGQRRQDLDPAVIAILTFTGQEPEKCLDWINRIRNICNQVGRSLHQELMNKSEPVVQNFIGTMGDTWTDEEVIEEVLKYFSDIPTPPHAITKLRALLQGEEEAIITYNQRYRTLVERVERKLVDKIDSYIELEQYLGSIILPIRKSIRSNIYWKSKHVPRTLGEAMKKAEELYMKHIYAIEGQTENRQAATISPDVTINKVNVAQKPGQYSQRAWRGRENSEILLKQDNFQNEANTAQKQGQYGQRAWRNKENSEISLKQDGLQSRTRNEDNRQLPRGSYTHILVNPTQLSDTEFTAWMDRLVEARRNRQENKPRPYRQFRKPYSQNRREMGETTQERLKNKLKLAEELNTDELMSHMRCELVDIEEAVDMYNLDVEECRSA